MDYLGQPDMFRPHLGPQGQKRVPKVHPNNGETPFPQGTSNTSKMGICEMSRSTRAEDAARIPGNHELNLFITLLAHLILDLCTLSRTAAYHSSVDSQISFLGYSDLPWHEK